MPFKFKRGTAFFFNALDVHRGSGIPKASLIGVTNPRLMAFFAIELTQGPNLQFPSLHVTQSIKRPQLGAPGGRVAKTVPCQGAVRCRGKVVATAATGRLCVPPTKMAFVCHARRGRSKRRGRRRSWWRTPMGSALSNVLSACSRWQQQLGIFCCRAGGVGGRWLPPSLMRRCGGSQATPISAPWPRCAMGRHCPGPPCKGMWGLGFRWGAFWW